ncbi:MAG: hypothetical protein QF692_01275 [Alphaproteobacteria bacterium]|mgnify:CR=1 FL=1|jgi:hypothetical protein|nr:hypothetical protein [Alphaproteobacteria bacterium]MDP7221874.1 hypothetical protein [Alphaproteobacteria bacterium]
MRVQTTQNAQKSAPSGLFAIYYENNKFFLTFGGYPKYNKKKQILYIGLTAGILGA